MIRRILVCLADDDSSLAAQEIALTLARDSEAPVTCLATVDTHSASLAAISPGIGTTFYAVQAAQAVEEHLQKVASERIARFHRRAEELHVPCVARLGEGIPWQSIELASCFHDLLVIGRGAHFDSVSDGKSRTPGRSLRKLLDHSSCPLLVVSSAPLSVTHVITGLDGRSPSARALRAFLQSGLFPDAAVTAVHCTGSSLEEDLDLGSVQRYLEAHGRTARVLECGGKPDEEIQRLSRDLPAELVVMGPHGKPRLAEWTFGSTTRELLGTSQLALFVAG